MKTIYWYSVLALVIASVLPAAASAEDVIFADANLENAVRDELGITAPTPITGTDMETMGELFAYDQNISNIQGLQYATNLTRLSLYWGQISDISAVSGLTNLTSLSLSSNQISNISSVSGLTNLNTLALDHNQISDISSVADLTNLTGLYLRGNEISDISVMSGLTNLTTLQLWANQISDITAVSGLINLTNLSVPTNQISDMSAVSGLTELNTLTMGGNQISDISAVSGLTNLNRLEMWHNQISDISAISGLSNLGVLYLDNNQISDISAISELTNLTVLNLEHNPISDISAVSGLTNLRELYLKNNQIETINLSGSDLSSLRWFEIAFNPLKSVLLADATLSQTTYDAIMNGGSSRNIGIAEMGGVLTLDMSGVDFAGILDLSAMYGMDDLEELLLVGAINLDGGDLCLLTGELDSLNWLDITGAWDGFDVGAQDWLNTWDDVEGNTLVTPEPCSLALLGLGGLVLRRRKVV